MSLWNPYAFTPTGQPVAPVAPPALRVIGGQATAQQLTHAQDAFYRFCASTRLSAVPNPVETGRLPDGTQYRIVKVGPQTIMEIWPGVQAQAWENSGIGISVLIGGQRYLFLITLVNGSWKVTRPPEFFGGDGLWIPASTASYYLTFNAQQQHDGYFPSKDSAVQTPPTPVAPSASKWQAVAYGNEEALSGAAVVGNKYVGVGRPNVMYNVLNLTLYRTDAVTRGAIKTTPFEAAAAADDIATVSAVVGVIPENMALHQNSAVRASIPARGDKALFVFQDLNKTPDAGVLSGLGSLGMADRPVTKAVNVSLPAGSLEVIDVPYNRQAKCRQVFKIERAGNPYRSTERVPAELPLVGHLGLSNSNAIPVDPPAALTKYDAGGEYIVQPYRITQVYEFTNKAEYTGYRWLRADGSAQNMLVKLDHNITSGFVALDFSHGSVGGCISSRAPYGPPHNAAVGVVSSSPVIGAEFLYMYPVEIPSPEVAFKALPPVGDRAAYAYPLGNYLGRVVQSLPIGIKISTTYTREDKIRDSVEVRGGAVALREADVLVELVITDTLTAFDQVLKATYERSYAFRCQAEVVARSLVYAVPELGVTAFVEASTEVEYDGETSDGARHVLNYEVSRSFVVFHGDTELFRTEPTKQTQIMAFEPFAGAFRVTGFEHYEEGDITASWEPLGGSGSLWAHKLAIDYDAMSASPAGVKTVSVGSNAQVLVDAICDREITMPTGIGPTPFIAQPGVLDYSLAHAFDPNSGAGAVLVFKGAHPTLLNRGSPIAGWAVPLQGAAVPLTGLLSGLPGYPFVPSARIEAVISV